VAAALGAELGTRGFGLLTGGFVGVDAIAAREFTAAVTGRGESVGELLVHVMRSGAQPAFAQGRVEHVATDEESIRRSVELSDAVVMIGGLGFLRDIATIALEAGRPVLPLGATGGDAQSVHDLILRGWDRYAGWGVSREDFELIGQPRTDLVPFVLGLLEKLFARRGGDPSRPSEDFLYYFGGIDPSTGDYLVSPMTAAQIAALAADPISQGDQSRRQLRDPFRNRTRPTL
jgi:hypothetical protein